MLKEAGQSAKLVADGLLGSLKIGFVENTGWEGFVPEVFNRFRSEAADVRVELVPFNTPVQFEQMVSGDLDGGFVYLFGEPPAGVEVIQLVVHDVVLAIPRQWDMPEDEPVEAKSLNGKPFVLFPRNVYPEYFDRLLGACSHAGLNLRIVQQASTEAAILSLVSAGVGAAIVNSANRGRPPALARFLPLSDISVPLPLAFAYRQEPQSPAMLRFIAVLSTVLERFT
jgi:DNA-binding transcriptional LysR family regulator